MAPTDRVALLRSLELFDHYKDDRLRALAGYLEPLSLEDGAAVFAEGTDGDGLYFIVSGRVRVAKRLGGGGEKDLASLGPGDCLGEMALLDSVKRSASAYAAGATELLRLKRDDLQRWLKADASLAMEFFAELVSVQSRRLRRTSSEVALLYDLSSLLLETHESAKALLAKALDRLLPHLEGEWSADARVYSIFNEELEPAAARGAEALEDGPVPGSGAPFSDWTDERTLALVLRAPRRLLGVLRFRAKTAPDSARRAETARTLEAAARLLGSALENLEFRTDEALRERLRSRSHGTL
ncbi:MAG: cyclic nucleotide-binding domain-containing protein [Elusimicrobiota bacterium]|nr:cyclic nucleotide-binding domain-containing protein [Elusimicrobiota bacterium]